MPVSTDDQGGGIYITYQDLDQIKTFVIVQMLGILAWAAKSVWDSFSGKKKKMEDDVAVVKETLSRIEERMVTKQEMIGFVRQEIEYAERLRQ